MSWSDRALLAESACVLAAARLLVITTPPDRLVSRMGGSPVGDEPVPDPVSVRTPESGPASVGSRIGAAVERTARFTFWRSMCLEKALAGKWMLRRRGIPSIMYVGMARQGDRFVAHAWLVGEGQTLTGAGQTSYAALAAFREPGSSGPAGPSGPDLKRV